LPIKPDYPGKYRLLESLNSCKYVGIGDMALPFAIAGCLNGFPVKTMGSLTAENSNQQL
jgi:hypothetical protein